MRGFTLVEVLLFVGVMAVMASTGFVVLVSTREAAKENKLSADTAHVNEVLQIYMANGGTLPATYNSTNMIKMLKARADASSAAKTMGLTGSYLDVRTTVQEQTAEEAATTQLRAHWTGSGYVITNGGGIGIKEFNLDDSLAAAPITTNSRDPGVLGVDTNKQWIWDYTDKDPTAVASGATPATADRPGYAAGAASAAASLNAPIVPNGTFPLINFNPSYYVTITDGSNPSNVSQLYYATSTGGGFALYSGSFAVTPGTTVSAYDKSIDPSRYSDSVVASGTVAAAPVTLQLGFTSAAASPLTYAQLGGAMSNGSATAPTATITLTNTTAIPAAYTVSSKFQAMYGYGTGTPSTSGPAFSGIFPPLSVSLGLANWGSATTLTVKARLVSSDSSLISSTTGTLTFTGAATALSSPTISPATESISAPVPVTIAAAAGVAPVGARTYYTVDGSDPGANSSTGEPTSSTVTLYSSSFTPVAGSGGSITIKARTYGPTGFGQWFTPSPVTQAVYTIAASGSPDGALVGNATVDGTFVGSIIYSNQLGNLGSINFNSGAKIKNGNIYFPGLPTLTFNGGSSSIIGGLTYDSNGNLTNGTPTSPLVVDLTGAATPVFNVTFNSGAHIDGKVYRRVTPPTFPTVSAPGSPSNGNTINVNSGAVTVNSSTAANLNINGGTVTLLPGNYGSINTGGTIILGTAGATTPSVYSIQSMNLNGGSQIQVVGPVILTMSSQLSVNTTMGNSAHPEYLQVNLYNGAAFTMNSSSVFYGQLVAPQSNVQLNGTFNGSVVAKFLNITSGAAAITFSLPPVVSG